MVDPVDTVPSLSNPKSALKQETITYDTSKANAQNYIVLSVIYEQSSASVYKNSSKKS